MQKVSINKAKQIAHRFLENTFDRIKKGDYRRQSQIHTPLYLHSSPGIGKSSIISQLCKEFDIGFVDLRLASMEASDLCGVPYVSHAGEETEDMKFSTPKWFPSKEKVEKGIMPEYGVVFFDELSNAPIGVQHAAYRIILDREVQTDVEMAPGWVVVAAGNLKEDKTGAKGVAPALANRFACHLTITHNFNDFLQYAYAQELHHHIIGFLNFKQDALYKFVPAKNDVAFATPRSWEQASNLLEMGFEGADLMTVLAGCVGDGLASEFVAFRKYYGKLPDFEKIMDGKEEYKSPKEKNGDRGIEFAIATSLIDCMLQNATKKERIKNLQPVIKDLNDDFVCMIFKTLKTIGTSEEFGPIVISSQENFRRITEYL